MFNIEQLEKELSQRKFKHRSWFKEGKDTAYALKSLATSLSGSWLEEKEVKIKGEVKLFKKPEYEYLIKASESKSFYRPKDEKELYYFTYHALQFESDQNKKHNNEDLSNIDWINERFELVKDMYETILNKYTVEITV